MKQQQHMIFGIRAVMEALEAGKELDKVLVKEGQGTPVFREMIRNLREKRSVIQYVPLERLNRITRKNHQGVIAYLSEVSYSDLTSLVPGIYESGENPLILVLDRISDVRNFGAIARTAECAGVHAIVIPARGSAMINADAVKTSAGALHKIPVCRYDNLADAVKYLKNSGLKIVAASEKAPVTIYQMQMEGPLAIIMGSEDSGISDTLMRQSDDLVSIPLKGTIESLNVSVAAGILLFEVVRQRTRITPGEAGG
ncbi:MAG: 23S rRNA (guanosine(2251)-2'-O)-methyltransferase RlmB [Bacteroidales bacterium]|nr:23S rRNA (guanosine(2251)-2'-O)-methyltransferase RlmB [Bacteroidales bacterium]